MEKYGVEQNVNQNDKTPRDEHRQPAGQGGAKHAGDAGVCRSCGQTLRSRNTTGVLLCPVCGTKPYEE